MWASTTNTSPAPKTRPSKLNPSPVGKVTGTPAEIVTEEEDVALVATGALVLEEATTDVTVVVGAGAAEQASAAKANANLKAAHRVTDREPIASSRVPARGAHRGRPTIGRHGMADHPNLVAARAGYEAFAKGDMATLGGLLADDIVWHVGGNNIFTGDYSGKESVFGFFARLVQETGGTFKNEVHDILVNDTHGVALVTASASRKGESAGGKAAQVFHMKDGKLTEFWSFAEDQRPFDLLWAAK